VIAQGILKLFVLFAIGAILYDVLTHPKGTQQLIGGINSLLGTGLAAASGRNVKAIRG
jgi:hypothetical protein